MLDPESNRDIEDLLSEQRELVQEQKGLLDQVDHHDSQANL